MEGLQLNHLAGIRLYTTESDHSDPVSVLIEDGDLKLFEPEQVKLSTDQTKSKPIPSGTKQVQPPEQNRSDELDIEFQALIESLSKLEHQLEFKRIMFRISLFLSQTAILAGLSIPGLQPLGALGLGGFLGANFGIKNCNAETSEQMLLKIQLIIDKLKEIQRETGTNTTAAINFLLSKIPQEKKAQVLRAPTTPKGQIPYV
ncbi:hypothetical protein D5R81_17535 [Parashewanella spongiae]|uniref:Uncharacterized protein n=1 Tax=Parashewanella spongiae TaxID=342950 RepID=A0A3A6TGP3_9GAMM|nr:hypothetical protein [Parashewanella spongiae]MCL1079865.1 hypothetical protein [Parashewanella spongiae]RJY06666.1 hypothetical protein D5R81_17535 [Parashewanella spongiae]